MPFCIARSAATTLAANLVPSGNLTDGVNVSLANQALALLSLPAVSLAKALCDEAFLLATNAMLNAS